MAEFPTENPNIHILSLAGGGFMGLFTAEVLSAIEAEGASLFETTDLFAGTSVGALIALGLACGVPAKKIAEVMCDKGDEIFPEAAGLPFGPPIVKAILQRGKEAGYSAEPLAAALGELVGETKMGELKRRAAVPAVDLTAGRYRVFQGGCDGVDADTKVADVALASAAAPTYFPPHAIGAELFADGGLIANAPDIVAVLEAQQEMAAAPGAIRLLSVGTTLSSPALAGAVDVKDWGMAQWGMKLVEFSMAGQISLTRAVAQSLIGENAMLVIDPVRSARQDEAVSLDKADDKAKATLSALAAAEVKAINDDAPKSRFLALWRAHKAQPVVPRPARGQRPRVRQID